MLDLHKKWIKDWGKSVIPQYSHYLWTSFRGADQNAAGEDDAKTARKPNWRISQDGSIA
jgi:hypothetical protein